jgi:GTP-binding protein
MFIDQATITVRSGQGGDGVVHFRKEKYVPRGGPDGGDGGRGGDVIFRVTRGLTTLYHLQRRHLWEADSGKRGSKSKSSGKSGEDLYVDVPAGTIVYDAESGAVIADLTEEDQTLIIAKGGRGGRGNQHFANSRNQTPHIAEKGEPAEERLVRLELKLIADIGIVGVPNAGKSTFLAALTNATPKIADYPFTTLQPNLGVAQLDDYNSVVLADIPGLIEGAHMGVGLGHDFLRHVQRTRVLIHLLDGIGEDPVADLAQINTELALFDEDLGEKPQVVAVNKADLPDVQAIWPLLEEELQKHGYEPMLISAVAGTNTRKLLYRAKQLLDETPEPEPLVELPVYRPQVDPNAFNIDQDENGWHVRGQAIERAAKMTYWEHDQSVLRFHRILEVVGIDQALRDAGVKDGDTVWIGEEFELEWSD